MDFGRRIHAKRNFSVSIKYKGEKSPFNIFIMKKANVGDYIRFDTWIIYKVVQVSVTNYGDGTSEEVMVLRDLRDLYCGVLKRTCKYKILKLKDLIEEVNREYEPIPSPAVAGNQIPLRKILKNKL